MTEAATETTATNGVASDATQEVPAGKPAEAPEQTIAALRDALAKANREAKDNRLARTELDKLRAAQMTDLERVTAERDELRRQAEESAWEVAMRRVQASAGMPDDDAAVFLTGRDEETLRRQAERYAQLREQAQAGTPKPDRTQGGSGQSLALNSDGLEQALRAKLGI